jgi:hypothetical protein
VVIRLRERREEREDEGEDEKKTNYRPHVASMGERVSTLFKYYAGRGQNSVKKRVHLGSSKVGERAKRETLTLPHPAC